MKLVIRYILRGILAKGMLSPVRDETTQYMQTKQLIVSVLETNGL